MASSKKYLSSVSAAAVALLLAASSSYALSWFSHSSNEKSADIDIVNHVRLQDGTTLEPGTYHIVVPLQSKTPAVQFFKDGKLVAKETAKAVPEPSKIDETEIQTDRKGTSEVLTKIKISGMQESLVFEARGHAAKTLKSTS